MNILNKGNKPTFVNRIRQEVLDITLATPEATRGIINWRVDQEVTFSDHKWITFEIESDRAKATSFRNPRKTNWELYRLNLKNLISNDQLQVSSVREIDQRCADISEAISKAYELSCQLSNPPPPGKSRGWTKELTELKRKARSTFYKAYNSKKNELPVEEQQRLWNIHQKAKSEYKKATRTRDRTEWRNFTVEVETCRPMAKLKVALAKDPFQPELINKDNGGSTTTSEEALEVLLNKPFPGIDTTSKQPKANNRHKRNPKLKDWTVAKRLITAERIRWAIKTFKPFKSPGDDQILPVFMIESGEILIPTLTNLLQASLAFTYIPKAWQEVKVLFIPKPGKSTYSVADAYR